MPGFTTPDRSPAPAGVTTTVPVTLASGGISPVTCPECGHEFAVCCPPDIPINAEDTARSHWGDWRHLRGPSVTKAP